MNRTIEINVSERAITTLSLHSKSLQAAIGYLSMWGNSDRVVLHIDKDHNIEASHQRKIATIEVTFPCDTITEYQQYYFIAGIYDAKADTYSFHS